MEWNTLSNRIGTMQKIYIILPLLIILIFINVINACDSAYYFISQSTQIDLIYDFDYASYKYNRIGIYALNSDDLSYKELIANYKLELQLYFDNFDIFDLSSLYFKHKGTITLSIDLNSSAVCVSRIGDEIGLCKDNLFMVDLNDYKISSCVKK